MRVRPEHQPVAPCLPRSSMWMPAVLAGLIVSLTAPLPAAATPAPEDVVATVEVEGITAHLRDDPLQHTRFAATRGYRIFRIVLENAGDSPRQVDLALPPYLDRDQGLTTQLRKRITIDGESSRQIELPQPPIEIPQRVIDVSVGEQRRVLHFNHAHGVPIDQRRHRPLRDPVLVSRGAAGLLDGGVVPSHSGASGPDHELLEWPAPLDYWHTNWLGYTPFNSIFLDGEALSDAPESVREAIAVYVRGGGTLMVTDPWQSPDDWAIPSTEPDDVTGSAMGMGMIYRIGEAVAEDPTALREHLAEAVQNSREAAHPPALDRLTERLDAAQARTLSVRGLIIIVVAFCLLIGPINMVVLYRMGRPTLLYATVPVLALLSCAGIVVYAAVIEGWQGREHVLLVSEIDSDRGSSHTLARVGYFAVLMPAEGLTFSRHAAVTPRGTHARRDPGARPPLRRIEIGEQRQQFTEGWISPRGSAYFHLSEHEPRSGRALTELERGEADALSLVNKLGAKLDTLYVLDDEGALHHATGVDDGERITLEAVDGEQRATIRQALQRKRVDLGQHGLLPPGLGDGELPLLPRPGRFIAVVEDHGFIAPALGRAGPDSRAEGVLLGPLPTEEGSR